MSRTRIKICGIRDVDSALAAAEAGADAIGFVFHPKSVRFVEPEEAADIAVMLPPLVSTVAVFVNPSLDKFMEMEELCPTTHTQFHGEEREELIRECAPVIKAVKFDAATIAAELKRWNAMPEVDAILVDGSAGGAGESFDWGALAAVRDRERIDTPLIIAGGLTPANVGEAIRVVRPWAVDVSSGVERAPGVKDPALMEAFCAAVMRADAALTG
jgi:phosphoribosylanthranilate isomerase